VCGRRVSIDRGAQLAAVRDARDPAVD